MLKPNFEEADRLSSSVLLVDARENKKSVDETHLLASDMIEIASLRVQ